MLNPVLNIAPPPAPTPNAKAGGAETADAFHTVLTKKLEKSTATDKAQAGEKRTDGKTMPAVKLTATPDLANQDPTPAADATGVAFLPPLVQTLKTTSADSSDTKTVKDPAETSINPALPTALPALPASSVLPALTVVDAKISTEPDTRKSLLTAVKTSSSQSGITPEKIDPAFISQPEQTVAVTPAIKAGTEIFKTPELAANAPTALLTGTQIASVMPPNSTALASNNTISAPLGSKAWPEEFTQKISWLSNQQNQVAELHLNPPDLGPMSVVLSVSDNQATALFTSPHSAVREAIENALPKLRESFADNGIMLGNATVSDQAPRDGGAANFSGQRPRSQPAVNNLGTSEVAAGNTPLIPLRRHTGMVDTFA